MVEAEPELTLHSAAAVLLHLRRQVTQQLDMDQVVLAPHPSTPRLPQPVVMALTDSSSSLSTSNN
jgi:hypothetical protein